jgi:hypothetical protein
MDKQLEKIVSSQCRHFTMDEWKQAAQDLAARTAERDALKAALDAARSLSAFAQHHPNCPDRFARNCSCGYTEAYKGNAEKYTALADLRRAALVRE